ncbi:hypothetical protein AVEN_110812-2-1, partial [Araneus ventricosus]
FNLFSFSFPGLLSAFQNCQKFQIIMGRHPEHKFLKEMTEKQNKMYERMMASRGQSKPRENRKPIVVLGLVQCDPQNIGKIIPKPQPAFQNRFRRPFIPMPQCPRCQFERNGNYDSQSQDEICEHCNKMVTYQAFRVCDCGCRPAGPGQQIPAFIPRMMAYGDHDFNMGNAKPVKVWGNSEPLYFSGHHEEE